MKTAITTKTLLQRKTGHLFSKQIELDLLRTLPNNKHFNTPTSDGIDPLRRVLVAYSIHNPTIGYCQGLNRIAAVALLFMSEEDAFWCMVAIIEVIMPPDYYGNTLKASQADQRVFRELLREKLPRLHQHLLKHEDVDTSLITFNWLLCIFCDNVPPQTMCHIWDSFLYEGSKVLFRYGLAFFKSVEEEILQLNDNLTIFHYLKRVSHKMLDTRALSNLAFGAMMNPLGKEKIKRLRAIHCSNVEDEILKLEEVRRDHASSTTAAYQHQSDDE